MEMIKKYKNGSVRPLKAEREKKNKWKHNSAIQFVDI